VDFGLFRPELNAALSYTDRTEGGRPPFDPVLMFKILVIQATNNLSDQRAEFPINDRLSFMRFLGLGLEDRVPDARTIWLFREKLTTAGAIKRKLNQQRVSADLLHAETNSLIEPSSSQKRGISVVIILTLRKRKSARYATGQSEINFQWNSRLQSLDASQEKATKSSAHGVCK
jgi:hypothetical protein